MAVEKRRNNSLVDDWLDEDSLELLACWARDGYTYEDISTRIGIEPSTLSKWRKEYPEINEALRKGREIVDYKVENALLKSALGYRTKEVKVITTITRGKLIETVKEVTEKDQAPNVSAIQVWLYNRLPAKWKKNRDNLIELDEEDTTIQVTVTRGNKENEQQQDIKKQPDIDTEAGTEEDELFMNEPIYDEVNTNITISRSEESNKKNKTKKKEQQTTADNTKVETKAQDKDYWPDDWEDD